MKILFNGCSFTYGDGFLDHEREHLNYPGLLANELSAQAINIAYPGSSNLEIFLRTIRSTQNEYFDLVVIQWSGLRRHWFEPCLGYSYRTADVVKNDWTHGCYINKKKQVEFNNHLTMMSGDYKELLDIGCFCQSLIDRFDDKIIFVDGLLNLPSDLFLPIETNDMFSYFNKFTKQILEFDSKPDDDIKKYHHQLFNTFHSTKNNWANIGSPWNKNVTDLATLGHHPGPRSHKWMADIILDKIKST
jgi:hypothetical protein